MRMTPQSLCGKGRYQPIIRGAGSAAVSFSEQKVEHHLLYCLDHLIAIRRPAACGAS